MKATHDFPHCLPPYLRVRMFQSLPELFNRATASCTAGIPSPLVRRWSLNVSSWSEVGAACKTPDAAKRGTRLCDSPHGNEADIAAQEIYSLQFILASRLMARRLLIAYEVRPVESVVSLSRPMLLALQYFFSVNSLG